MKNVELLGVFGNDYSICNAARVSFNKEASNYTEAQRTGSLLAFVHLFNLRLKPDAQQETRELVAEMLNEIKNIEGSPFKHSLDAFGL